jgi:hypothetical protein
MPQRFSVRKHRGFGMTAFDRIIDSAMLIRCADRMKDQAITVREFCGPYCIRGCVECYRDALLFEIVADFLLEAASTQPLVQDGVAQ